MAQHNSAALPRSALKWQDNHPKLGKLRIKL